MTLPNISLCCGCGRINIAKHVYIHAILVHHGSLLHDQYVRFMSIFQWIKFDDNLEHESVVEVLKDF